MVRLDNCMSGYQLLIYPLPSHHPKPQRRPLSQPDKIGQRDIGFEFEGEGQHFDAFVVDPFLFDQVGDFEIETRGGIPAHARGEGDDVGGQQAVEEVELVGDAAEAAVVLVVVGVKGFPLMDAVAQGCFPHVERMLVYVELGDAHVVLLLADAQGPVRLAEEVMGFLDALVEAEQHGAHLAVAGVEFVLDQGVALVVSARVVVVVVVPVVFEAHLVGHGPAEARQFPGIDPGVKRDGQCSESVHG